VKAAAYRRNAYSAKANTPRGGSAKQTAAIVYSCRRNGQL
jgi:hypothetical protein